MSSFGTGFSAGAGVQVAHEVAHKHGQKILGALIAKPTVGIRAFIEELVDSGLYRKNEGVSMCSSCQMAIERSDDPCPYCGASDFDEPPQPVDDEDGDNDDDFPVHGEAEENKYEIPIRTDVSQRFSEMLEELGWDENEAEMGGNILATIWIDWKRVEPFSDETYVSALNEIVKDPNRLEMLMDQAVRERLAKLFVELLAAEEKENKDTLIAEVRISKNETGGWLIWVNDPLRDYIMVDPIGQINLGDNKTPSVFMKAKAVHQYTDGRRDKITSLIVALLNHRRAFFEASTPDAAEESLGHRPLHQNIIANDAGIPESTLSRWCQRGAISIATPLGTYQLGDFFSRASSRETKEGQKTRDLTVKAIRELISDVRKMESAVGQKECLKILDRDYGIVIPERTLRYHRRAHKQEDA
jgi:hypothetical protein